MTVVVDFSKEDFVLRDMILSEVRLYDRSRDGKDDLIFVKFVGSKTFGTSPEMLYFGEKSFSELYQYRGKKFDVLLQSSNRGFNVSEIRKIG